MYIWMYNECKNVILGIKSFKISWHATKIYQSIQLKNVPLQNLKNFFCKTL